ncbi:MAG: metallophosphoesterase [candidate division KSB1 bacterium]|nr:metallophosphoesterase [candidate division KSB1 bacterium]
MGKPRGLLVGGFVLLTVVAATGCAPRPNLLQAIQVLPLLGEPDPAFRKGPYVQNVTATSAVIMWQSEAPEIGAVAYGTTERLQDTLREQEACRLHEIRIAGLEPSTRYYYRALSGGRPSPLGSFRTAVRAGEPFSFAVFGDSQNGPFRHGAIAERVLQAEPHFVLRTGDLVERGHVEKQWDLIYFRPAANLIRSVPVFAALGNHEGHAEQFFAYFSLPGNEQWYSFDYGNAHFVALDSDLDYLREGGQQLRWLEEDLASSRADWKVVFFHHPPFTAARRYYTLDRLERQRLLHPLFERHRVDLVFSGHDHNYERSRPIASRVGEPPVTYIVCGNGGAKMRSIGRRAWTAHAERTHGYVLVRIHGLRLHLEAWSVDGRKMDELEIDKSDSAHWSQYCLSAVDYDEIAQPDTVARALEEADDLLDEKRFAAAIPFFEKAYGADTNCVEALAGLAACYAGLDSVAKAVSLARMAVAKRPNLPDPYSLMVHLHRRHRHFEEALTWARKWCELEPDIPGPFKALAEVYEAQGQYLQAAQALLEGLRIWPSEAELYLHLGELCEKLKDRKAALAALERGLYWFWEESESAKVREARARVEKLRRELR